MVGEVVRLRAELKAVLPEKGEGLDHRDIPVHQARRKNIVANAFLQIKCPGGGRSPERSSVLSCCCKPLRAAGATSRTGKLAYMPHPAVLHPELAHRSCWNVGRLAVEAA